MACSQLEFTLTLSVVPEKASLTNTSVSQLVSSATRFVALLENNTYLQSGVTPAIELVLSLPSIHEESTLILCVRANTDIGINPIRAAKKIFCLIIIILSTTINNGIYTVYS